MTVEPTNAEKINKLPWSIAGNAANTVYLQFTLFGSVFVLFLSALNLDKTQIGFLLSLLPFSGLTALFIAPTVARYGYKKIFLLFFGGRNFFTALLMLTPWVVFTFGSQATLTYVAIVVAVFAVFRAVGVTAAFPWIQEYVPNSVRGKYSATNNVFSTLTGFAAITIAGFVINQSSGLNGFIILIGLGVMFGLLSVWFFSHVPGGAPSQAPGGKGTAIQELLEALRDKDLVFYLLGFGLVMVAITPLNSFLPLFMQEEVGLNSGNVVLLQNGVLLGGLLSTYLWGWTADRYGSRPIMLSGALLRILLPFFWMAMPRNNEISLYVALAIAVLQGIADMGWVIGTTRVLYVSIVPPEKRTEYMAVYYAWIGTTGGVSQLIGGQIVQFSAGLSGQFLIFTLDPYTGLFALGLILPIISIFLLRQIRTDTQVTVEQFAGLFLRGNPLTAMSSLIGYHFAKGERAMVEITERLGETKSPLTVEELLEVLEDPRFNVRMEAIISIARTRPDPRLTEALIHILNGTELALSTMAAWALGRIGDPQAIETLRAGLNSPYHSIRAHCTRALGALGDQAMAPLILERLEAEVDKGLQMAYASTLGKLEAEDAAQTLLDLLKTFDNEGARMELALSVARLVGNEGHFIQLLRHARQDTGTATAQALTTIRRKISKDSADQADLLELLTQGIDTLARNELASGADRLTQIIALLPPDSLKPCPVTILQACAQELAELKAGRLEYILLTLHTLEVGWEG